jgi:hypothetical protein
MKLQGLGFLLTEIVARKWLTIRVRYTQKERERERFLKFPISKTERNGLECSWIDGGFTVRKEGDP